ncbi:MAG: glutaconyl-CoA decarboxylase subunit gamma [Kofleriaceae bacterium]
MKKLTTLLGIVALSATFALAGCNKKKDEEGKAPAAKPAETTPTAPAAPAADTPAAAPTPSEAKPVEGQPAAATDIPAECTDYKATVEKLATCDKVPAADKDTLKQSFDKDFAALTATGADKVKAATDCKAAAEKIKTAHGKTCGW